MTSDEQLKEIRKIANTLRITAVTRRLLGIDKSSDYVHSDIKRILSQIQLPYPSRRMGLGWPKATGSLDLENPELRSKLYTAIQKLHGELQPIVFYYIDEISDGEKRFNPERTYKISRLLEYHAELWEKRTGEKLSTRVLLKQYDQAFRHNLSVYNSLIDSHNIVGMSGHHKKRLQNALGYVPDLEVNFGYMCYLSTDNPRKFKTRRDVAMLFYALYKSNHIFTFGPMLIEKKDNVLTLMRYVGYVIFPCRSCNEKYELTPNNIRSALDHITEGNTELDKTKAALIDEIEDMVNCGRLNDFLPAPLKHFSKR